MNTTFQSGKLAGLEMKLQRLYYWIFVCCIFRHEFHKLCIDPWLLEHRTCPMCKMDILKHYGFVVSSAHSLYCVIVLSSYLFLILKRLPWERKRERDFSLNDGVYFWNYIALVEDERNECGVLVEWYWQETEALRGKLSCCHVVDHKSHIDWPETSVLETLYIWDITQAVYIRIKQRTLVDKAIRVLMSVINWHR